MTDIPLVLSSTALSEYLSCGHRYLLSSVYRVPRIGSVAMAIGQVVHAAAEAMHLGEAFHPLRVWERQRPGIPDGEYEADPDAIKDSLLMAKTYRDKVMPTFHPTMIERPFLITIEGVAVSGVIDAADERTDDLRDTKTVRGKTINGKKPTSFDPAKHRVQGSLYGLAYRHLTGRWPKRIGLDVVTRAGRYKYYPITPDYSEAANVVAVVASGIARGEYEPTGKLAGICDWCPVRLSCTYYEATGES